MRFTKALFLAVLALALTVSAADKGNQKYVSPTKDATGVYKNETRALYEQPIATVGLQDRLLVVGDGRTAYKVKLASGEIGWVEKSSCVATGKSKTYVFDNADVIGYLDNPTPVYIIDADDPNSDPINLTRSFKEALRVNVDQETIERQTK
jgi:hypothetical protein